jgi:hypothetical protein
MTRRFIETFQHVAYRHFMHQNAMDPIIYCSKALPQIASVAPALRLINEIKTDSDRHQNGVTA